MTGGCVGFRDDESEGDALFDAVVRAVRLVTTGELDEVDWLERRGDGPID